MVRNIHRTQNECALKGRDGPRLPQAWLPSAPNPALSSSDSDPLLAPQTLPSRCNQCVIITSSSHLLGTKLGPEIERAECTIRMNDAPTSGYSADVGNKTTFRVVAHSSVFRVLRRPQEFVNRTPETVFIFWGPPNKMQKPQGSLLRVIQRAGLAFPNMEAYAVSPTRMQQFDDLFRGETGKDRYQPTSHLPAAVIPGLILPACTMLRV